MNLKSLYVKHCALYHRWDNTELHQWECRRAKGMFLHVCINGLGWFGVYLFIGITLATTHLADQGSGSVSFHELILINVALCSFSGLLFGLITWHATESGYRLKKCGNG